MISALIPAALGVAKAGFGLYQNIKGNNILQNTERPEDEIPEEVLANLTQAQIMALEGLPAEQKQEYLRNIDRGTSTALSASASRKGGLSMIDNILQQQTDAYSTLLTKDSVARMNNQRAVMNQRQNLANYKDKAFEYNQDEPYRMKMAEGQGLVGSGIQNIWGGLSDTGSAALSFLNQRKKDKLVVDGITETETIPLTPESKVENTNPFENQNIYRIQVPTPLQNAGNYTPIKTNYSIWDIFNSLSPEEQMAFKSSLSTF